MGVYVLLSVNKEYWTIYGHGCLVAFNLLPLNLLIKENEGRCYTILLWVLAVTRSILTALMLMELDLLLQCLIYQHYLESNIPI